MDDDGQVISFEDAVRRHRALEDAEKKKGTIHEVKLSEPISHLLDGDSPSGEEDPEGRGPQEKHPSPEELRRIVEREFADEGGRSGPEPEERPRPHLVGEDEEEPDSGGQLCSFETRRCWDPGERPDGSSPD
jgi:hypothetical protein